jgi:hypothetical protein
MRTETPIPIPICAADGDERVAGITSSRRPKPNKRTEGGSFVIFLSFGPVGLLLESAARQRADLAQKVRRGMVHNQTFGLKNISLRSNTATWSTLLGKKLFGISRRDKFWRFSGKKIRKLQDSPVIQRGSWVWRSGVLGFTAHRELLLLV